MLNQMTQLLENYLKHTCGKCCGNHLFDEQTQTKQSQYGTQVFKILNIRGFKDTKQSTTMCSV